MNLLSPGEEKTLGGGDWLREKRMVGKIKRRPGYGYCVDGKGNIIEFKLKRRRKKKKKK
jgi:hypothetical protein